MNRKNQLIIDKNIIRSNYNKIKELTNSAIGAVVKADAYGLGATKISEIFYEENCRDFFVANLEEGVVIRSLFSDANIYVLNGSDVLDCKFFQEYRLTPVINFLDQLDIWLNYFKEFSPNAPIILHFDSGMNRYGIREEELQKILNIIKEKNANVKMIMSHLASSEEVDNEYNLIQLNNFKNILKYFPGTKASFSNSAGIFLGPEYHFDLLRPGAALYGLCLNERMNVLKSPLKLFSPIVQLKILKKGEKLGYNGTYEAICDTKIATLPLGYADGIPRSLSNKGVFYIEGYPAKIVGRVSMDYINIDVSNVPEKFLFLGKMVEILGDNQTPDILAEQIDTVGYEILTCLGKRYERKYI